MKRTFIILTPVLIYTLLITTWSCQGNNSNSTTPEKMNKTEEIIIKNDLQITIAVIHVKDSLLHGRCQWYDGRGKPIADGAFQNGQPYTGTFINWANFLPEIDKANPYSVSTYCKDWVTRFEMSFRSALPKYNLVLEIYKDGVKITE